MSIGIGLLAAVTVLLLVRRSEKGMDQEEIIRGMVEDYEVSEEKVAADVQKLIGQMQENGFLEE